MENYPCTLLTADLKQRLCVEAYIFYVVID